MTKAKLLDQELVLYPHRGMMWKDCLLVADLHLGKVNHFRKAGLPVPGKVNDENTERLVDLIMISKPAKVILLGDLFHSHYNAEWDVFLQIVRHFVAIEFHLVEGNHDIMSPYQYQKAPLIIHEEMEMGPFTLTHIPLEADQIAQDQYNLAGHIHPAVSLRGKGRQSVKLPCFYFGENQGFLPAFGNFTGNYRIKPTKKDQVYVVLSDKVIRKN